MSDVDRDPLLLQLARAADALELIARLVASMVCPMSSNLRHDWHGGRCLVCTLEAEAS